MPTDFSLNCAAMQGFFIRKNGEWRLSGALAFCDYLCDIDFICVSMNQFNPIAVLYLKFCSLKKKKYFQYWFNYFFTKDCLIFPCVNIILRGLQQGVCGSTAGGLTIIVWGKKKTKCSNQQHNIKLTSAEAIMFS